LPKPVNPPTTPPPNHPHLKTLPTHKNTGGRRMERIVVKNGNVTVGTEDIVNPILVETNVT